MSSCPAINSLTLSREGQGALKDIQQVMKLAKYLQITLTAGTLLVVLYEEKVIPQVFNINMADWEALGVGIKAISDVKKEQIKKISMGMALRSGGGDEYRFWKAMYYLCMFN
ncbi:MAG: hypothetical protein ACKE51_04180 [Methylococcaceae bacterium]